MLFVCYPKCSTCQKAKAWLDAHGVSVTVRDIKTDRPTAEELRAWHARSGLPLKRFFNTSGLQYKALGLKDKLPTMTEDEQLALLATDGMLVKRLCSLRTIWCLWASARRSGRSGYENRADSDARLRRQDRRPPPRRRAHPRGGGDRPRGAAGDVLLPV